MGSKPKPQTTVINNTTTSNQTAESKPWGPAEPLLMDMLQNAQRAYQATPKTSAFVPPNADQLAAVNWFRDQAAGTATGGQELRDLGQRTAAGYFLHPDSNPYIAAAADAAIRPLRQQLDQNILTIGDAAQMAGAYGGDRSALLKSKALTGFNTAAADTRATMYAENYARERALQQNAGNLLMQANQIMLQPGLILDQIGQQQRGWEIEKALAAMDAPWAGLDRYAQILSQVSPYGTTTSSGTQTQQGTTTTTPAQMGRTQSALSGALGGAASGFSAGGPWGALIGGTLGGIGGLFG